MVNSLCFLGCSKPLFPNSVCKKGISHLKGKSEERCVKLLCNSTMIVTPRRAWFIGILHPYCWLSSLSVVMQTLSRIPMKERKLKKQIFHFNFNFVKISILSFSLGVGGKVGEKPKQEFWSETFAFLGWLWPRFGLYASDVYGSKLHFFTWGKKSFNSGLQCSL